MKLISTIVASLLLTAPTLALADQAPATGMDHHYSVVDDAGNVVGTLYATDSVTSNLLSIGHVRTQSSVATSPETNASEGRLLTPLDFTQAWTQQYLEKFEPDYLAAS
jgi:hypothetical protein